MVCCSLSPLGGNLHPGVLEAVDGSALQPGQDCLQGVVVAKLVALTGNLQKYTILQNMITSKIKGRGEWHNCHSQ